VLIRVHSWLSHSANPLRLRFFAPLRYLLLPFWDGKNPQNPSILPTLLPFFNRVLLNLYRFGVSFRHIRRFPVSRPGTGSGRLYLFDETRPESRAARAVVDDALQHAEGRVDPTPVRDQLVTEPGSRYIDFLIPGLLGFNLMSSGLWGVGFVIVDMRVRKLIKRMMATPMSRAHFLLSFVLVRGAFLLGELPVLLCFACWVFHVPIRGSIPLVVGLSVLGSLMFAGLGLLLGSRAQNTHTVAGLVNLLTLPMMVTSGVFFSAGRFPDALQPVIRLLPLTAVIDAIRAVMLDGAGLAAVTTQIAIIAAWGLISFLVALRLFRWH
jgi:ABC-2 type transport system permease protein